MFRSILISAGAVLAVAAVAAPVAAESTRHVPYGDLDLSSAAGATELRQRVSTAVNQVCGKIEVRNIHSPEMVQTCRTETWAMTEPQLNAVLSQPTVRILANASITVGRANTAAR